MTSFNDRILQFEDTAGDDLFVTDPGGTTTAVSKYQIQQFINNASDPIASYGYNFAVRLALNGITTISNPDGTMRDDALALLRSVSFKGYP